jgi:hypothetical protein
MTHCFCFVFFFFFFFFAGPICQGRTDFMRRDAHGESKEVVGNM